MTATVVCAGSRKIVPVYLENPGGSPKCPSCGQSVRTTTPKYGDGSVDVYYRHRRPIRETGT